MHVFLGFVPFQKALWILDSVLNKYIAINTLATVNKVKEYYTTAAASFSFNPNLSHTHTNIFFIALLDISIPSIVSV